MLTSLCIENFAIVKHLDIDFQNGMTAFTGETGAGKSIMIDALGLLLGGRADISVVRQDEEKCVLSAIFTIEPHSEPWEWLKLHEIDADTLEVHIRRVLYAEGRSKCFINGQLFPVQKIKELSAMLVHIHGQHEHQILLHHATHRQQLDRFADHPACLQAVFEHYQTTQKIKEQLEQLKNNDEQHTGRVDLLEYQVNELSELNLRHDEMDALNEEHQNLHHAKDYLHTAQLINELLHTENTTPGICDLLNQILHQLQGLPEQNQCISTIQELINSALIQCEEAANEMQHFAQKIQIDPARLQEIEARLSQLHQMARKYHIEISELPQHFDRLKETLAALNASETDRAELERHYEQSLANYTQAAISLRASREKAAITLSKTITQIIQQLGMPTGYLKVSITPLDKIHPHGLDKVEYQVCTNPGMAMDALQKVASGGELSRISLAIQMITAQQSATPTLLFDEVDVGIGGATAALVGQLLRQVGERLQVFCVTHQPQVAAAAHHHCLVEKYNDQQHTYSRILPLAQPAKIDEIARMLGGLMITTQTRSHAEELILQSQVEATT